MLPQARTCGLQVLRVHTVECLAPLAAALPDCPRLQQLSLQGLQPSDVALLSAALQRPCASLQQLQLPAAT